MFDLVSELREAFNIHGKWGPDFEKRAKQLCLDYQTSVASFAKDKIPQRFMDWLEMHEGEATTQGDIAEAIIASREEVNRTIGRALDAGKIRRENAGRGGVCRYWLG